MGTRAGVSARWLTLVAVAFATLGGPCAWGDEDEEEGGARPDGAGDIAQVEAALKGRKVSAAAELLQKPEAADRIAGDLPSAVRLARITLANAVLSYIRDKENAPKLADATLAIARKAAAAPQPEGCPAPAGLDDRARALAMARLAVASTNSLLDKAVPPAEWTEPFATLRKASPDDTLALVDVLLCIGVVGIVLDEDAPVEPALRAAAETAAFAVRTFPEGEAVSEMALRANLALACGLAWTKPAEAKSLLPAALSALAANGRAIESDEDLVGLWNRGVGEARRLGIPTKHAMLAKKVSATWFEFEIPKHSGWTVERGDGQLLFQIHRDRGSRSQAYIQVYHYDWNKLYVDDQNREVGGDNRGGLMRQDHKESLALFSKVTRDDKASKAKLSRRMTNVIGYDVRGLSEEGDEMRLRAWYFAGEKRRYTFRVVLLQVGSIRDRDGQMDFVLESLRETE